MEHLIAVEVVFESLRAPMVPRIRGEHATLVVLPPRQAIVVADLTSVVGMRPSDVDHGTTSLRSKIAATAPVTGGIPSGAPAL